MDAVITPHTALDSFTQMSCDACDGARRGEGVRRGAARIVACVRRPPIVRGV